MGTRLLHSASWLLAAGTPLAEARFAAAQRVVEAVATTEAQVLVLAGDTFAHPTVGAATLERGLALLAAARCPVYVLPGLRDAPLPGSLWEHPAWRDAPANVVVLHGKQPLQPEALSATVRVLAWPPAAGLQGATPVVAGAATAPVHVGVAYAADTEEGKAGLAAAWDAARRGAVHYLALGGDRTALPDDLQPRGRVALSPEVGSFAELEEEGEPTAAAWLVEVTPDGGAPDGGAPRIHAVPTGGLRWRRVQAELRDRGCLDQLIQRLRKEVNDEPPGEMLALHLSGRLPLREAPALEALVHELEARCVAVELQWQELEWALPGHEEAATLPPGPVRDALTRLLGEAARDKQAQAALQALLQRLPRGT